MVKPVSQAKKRKEQSEAEEVRRLHELQLSDREDFQAAMAVMRHEEASVAQNIHAEDDRHALLATMGEEAAQLHRTGHDEVKAVRQPNTRTLNLNLTPALDLTRAPSLRTEAALNVGESGSGTWKRGANTIRYLLGLPFRLCPEIPDGSSHRSCC